MKYRICTVLIAAVAVAASCGLARADYIGPGEVLELDLSGNTGDTDDSGITIWNQSDVTGLVAISGPVANESGDVEEGFVLLDGTLQVTIGVLQPGDYRVLIRREYAPERVRAIPRKKAVRVMRRKREIDRVFWTRARPRRQARQALERREAPKRALREKRNGLLGRQGYYEPGCYAWTIVDQASDFAVGVQIPEPSTMVLLFGAGGCLLGMHRSRRRP